MKIMFHDIKRGTLLGNGEHPDAPPVALTLDLDADMVGRKDFKEVAKDILEDELGCPVKDFCWEFAPEGAIDVLCGKEREKATFKVLLGHRKINAGMGFGEGEGVGIPNLFDLSWTKKPGAKPVEQRKIVETLGRALKKAINEQTWDLEALSVEHMGPGKALGIIKD